MATARLQQNAACRCAPSHYREESRPATRPGAFFELATQLSISNAHLGRSKEIVTRLHCHFCRIDGKLGSSFVGLL
jgi:hypothetical protein